MPGHSWHQVEMDPQSKALVSYIDLASIQRHDEYDPEPKEHAHILNNEDPGRPKHLTVFLVLCCTVHLRHLKIVQSHRNLYFLRNGKSIWKFLQKIHTKGKPYRTVKLQKKTKPNIYIELLSMINLVEITKT